MARGNGFKGGKTLASGFGNTTGPARGGGGFGSAPTLATGPLRSGDNRLGGGGAGQEYPATYGGGASLHGKLRSRQGVSGQGEGGVSGATPSSPGTIPGTVGQ